MNILGWVKSNWIIVVCVAVMLIAPPVAWYFSSSMAKETSAQREQEAVRVYNDVRGLRTTYSIPATRPGEQGVSFSYEPNQRVTEWFRQQNQQLKAEMVKVVEEAVEFNRRGREPVVEGVLPTPPEDRTRRQTLLIEFAQAFVPDGDSVYERMLADLNAGGPVSSDAIATRLQSELDREVQRRQSQLGEGEELTIEEENEIREQLVQMRMGEYRRRAREISVYASLDVFPTEEQDSPYFPRQQASALPTVVQCFRWQWDAWLADDVLAAIRTANSDESGSLMRVEEAPVKRLLLVEADAPAFLQVQQEMTGRFGEVITPDVVQPGPDPRGAVIEPSFDAYLTGRPPSELNQLYDTRIVSVLVHVDSARLPQVIESFSRTNFMTVTSLRLSSVDLDEQLGRGYFYGDDHVVQAQFDVEALYLRQWTKQYMPPQVRTQLGLPETDPETETPPDLGTDPGTETDPGIG